MKGGNSRREEALPDSTESATRKFITVTKKNNLGGITRTDINNIIKEVYGDLAELWHREFRPKHFTHGAYTEYGYKARKTGYNKRKKEKLPLVFSGTSRELSSTYRVVVTRNGSRVVMPLVKALNFKPPNSSINMRDEFTRTSNREIEKYGVVARRSLRQKLRGHKVSIKVGLKI